MKLIIENSDRVYVYQESEAHHRKAEKLRHNLERLDPDVLKDDCDLSHFPNSYMVIDTNSMVDDRLRRKNLPCSYCAPHKGDNKTYSKRGPKKRKGKNKRR